MAIALKSASRAPVAGKRTARASGILRPRRTMLVPRASTEPTTTTSTESSNEYLNKAQAWGNQALEWTKAKWEATEDSEKPVVVVIILGVILAQIAIGATIDVVDRIPVVNKFLELLGLGVTGYYIYKIITDPEERDTVKQSVTGFVNKVTGDK